MQKEVILADPPAFALMDSQTQTKQNFPEQSSIEQDLKDRAEVDKALVQKIQSGSSENFVLLYDSYLDKIYRFLYFRTNHQETAEDLTSQTFLKAFDKINSFDPSKGTFQSWLYQIARNLLIDHYRVPRRNVELSAASNVPADSSPERDTEQQFTLAQVQNLLASLSEPAKELVVLRIWEELPYSEIAKIMDKSEASLKMQFSRIIASLRDHPLLLSFIIFVIWGTNL